MQEKLEKQINNTHDLSSASLRRPQKFGWIFLLVLTLLSNFKIKRKMVPIFCGLLRIYEL
jgi:hypothetical protein